MKGDLRRNTGMLLLGAALALLGMGATHAQTPPKAPGKRMVCWQDDNGAKACGDAVPAQYADRERSVLDGSGRTIKVIPGALSPAQRAEQEAQAREMAALQQAADQRAAYDRSLLATYSKPQELAELRDDRLESLDTRIGLAEAGLKRDSVSLAELRSRLPAEGSAEKATPRLLAQIKGYEESVADSQRVIQEMRRDREKICMTFARDIQRFQELKTGAVTYRSPCPAPGSLEVEAPTAAKAAGNTGTVKLQPQIR